MNQIAPVKFADVIKRHSELFHHAPRGGIFGHGDGDDFIEFQRFKSVSEKRSGGFASKAFAPKPPGNRVADFRFARFLQAPQTAPADKRARLFFDDRAEADFFGFPEARNHFQPVDAFLSILRRADKMHYLGVASESENRVGVVFGKAPQDE